MNDIKISNNFRLYEFSDKNDNTVKVDERLVEVLQAIRDKIAKPIVITSAYRTLTSHENIYKRLYGEDWLRYYVKNSQHLLGKAVDFTIRNARYSDYMIALELIENSGIIKGIGNGIEKKGFIHIDTRDSKEIIRWVY